MKQKWLPIQAVHTLWNSCAFVVLSGNVMHEGTWNKWRETGKPDDWKILTKVEHTKRTAEYLALLEKDNPRGMHRNQEDVSKLPPIARPAALPMAFEPLPEDTTISTEGKKKRKRRKPGKPSNKAEGGGEHLEEAASQEAVNEPDTGMAGAPEEQPDAAEPATNKKKRKRRKSGRANNVDETATDVVAPANNGGPSKKRRR